MVLRSVEKRPGKALAPAAIALLFLPEISIVNEKTIAAKTKKRSGDKKFESGKGKFDVPEISDDRLVTSINVAGERPLTDCRYGKAVHGFAERSPRSGAASRRLLTPGCVMSSNQGRDIQIATPSIPSVRLRRRGKFGELTGDQDAFSPDHVSPADIVRRRQ